MGTPSLGWPLDFCLGVSSRHSPTKILDGFSSRVVLFHPAQHNYLHCLGSFWRPTSLEAWNGKSCLLALVCQCIRSTNISQERSRHECQPAMFLCISAEGERSCKQCPLFKLSCSYSAAKNSTVMEQIKVFQA